jgi:YfiH family protein
MRPHPGDGFEWVDAPGGPALVCRALEPFASHLFTTRKWALGSSEELDNNGFVAWAVVANALGAPPSQLARLHQVHGATVVVKRAGGRHDANELADADIIITDDRELVLAIQTADCVPFLMADPETGTVAAAHAGWRGLAARVPQVAVKAMAEQFGTRPSDLVVAIGPSISAARYEVGGEVRARFEAAGFKSGCMRDWFPAETREEHWLFDGWRSARDQLDTAGVPPRRIHSPGLCTWEHGELFCSYRRDGNGAGRMAAAIRVS